MKEIGGYIEIEHNNGTLYHENALKLNCGRACLEYLIRAYNIKRIWLPGFLCDSVFDKCRQLSVDIETYSLGDDFSIPLLNPGPDDWVYIVNYYGQLNDGIIKGIHQRFKNIICDYSQSYFQLPLEGVPTIYTCRKYFGVADGAFLYTSKVLNDILEIDMSMDRLGYLFGRYEKDASSYYDEFKENDEKFKDQPVRLMSRITENMLRGVNYEYVSSSRSDNWNTLHDILGKYNKLSLCIPKGPFAYPFYSEKADAIRLELKNKKIYIPVLWPNVLEDNSEMSNEYKMAMNILPLPCDQRYTSDDMKYLADQIMKSTLR